MQVKIQLTPVKKSGQIIQIHLLVLDADKDKQDRYGHSDPNQGKTIENDLEQCSNTGRNSKSNN
jgi:hypothetical protein